MSQFLLFMVVFQAFHSGESHCRLSLPGTDFQCHSSHPQALLKGVCGYTGQASQRCASVTSPAALPLCLLAGSVWHSQAGCPTTRNTGQPLRVRAWKRKRLLGREIKLSSENCMGVRPDTRMGAVLGFLLCPSAVACCGLCSCS